MVAAVVVAVVALRLVVEGLVAVGFWVVLLVAAIAIGSPGSRRWLLGVAVVAVVCGLLVAAVIGLGSVVAVRGGWLVVGWLVIGGLRGVVSWLGVSVAGVVAIGGVVVVSM